MVTNELKYLKYIYLQYNSPDNFENDTNVCFTLHNCEICTPSVLFSCIYAVSTVYTVFTTTCTNAMHFNSTQQLCVLNTELVTRLDDCGQ